MSYSRRRREYNVLSSDKETLFYTADEMAAMCTEKGVHRSTWWRWVRDGIAPQPVDIGGNKWLASDIKEWLKKKKESCQTGRLISE